MGKKNLSYLSYCGDSFSESSFNGDSLHSVCWPTTFHNVKFYTVFMIKSQVSLLLCCEVDNFKTDPKIDVSFQ